jgi:hypothetical protein
VPRGKDAPLVFYVEAMALTDGRQGARERHAELQSVDQGGIADWRCTFRQRTIVKNVHRA